MWPRALKDPEDESLLQTHHLFREFPPYQLRTGRDDSFHIQNIKTIMFYYLHYLLEPITAARSPAHSLSRRWKLMSHCSAQTPQTTAPSPVGCLCPAPLIFLLFLQIVWFLPALQETGLWAVFKLWKDDFQEKERPLWVLVGLFLCCKPFSKYQSFTALSL